METKARLFQDLERARAYCASRLTKYEVAQAAARAATQALGEPHASHFETWCNECMNAEDDVELGIHLQNLKTAERNLLTTCAAYAMACNPDDPDWHYIRTCMAGILQYPAARSQALRLAMQYAAPAAPAPAAPDHPADALPTGIYGWYPELGESKPVAHMETGNYYGGSHAWVQTPLQLKTGPSVKFEQTYTAADVGPKSYKLGWHTYRVTPRGLQALAKQYRISREILLD